MSRLESIRRKYAALIQLNPITCDALTRSSHPTCCTFIVHAIVQYSAYLCAAQVRYVGVADLSNILSFAKLHLLGRSTQCFDCLAETALNSLVFIEPPLFYIDTRYAVTRGLVCNPANTSSPCHA